MEILDRIHIEWQLIAKMTGKLVISNASRLIDYWAYRLAVMVRGIRSSDQVTSFVTISFCELTYVIMIFIKNKLIKYNKFLLYSKFINNFFNFYIIILNTLIVKRN